MVPEVIDQRAVKETVKSGFLMRLADRASILMCDTANNRVIECVETLLNGLLDKVLDFWRRCSKIGWTIFQIGRASRRLCLEGITWRL